MMIIPMYMPKTVGGLASVNKTRLIEQFRSQVRRISGSRLRPCRAARAIELYGADYVGSSC